MDSDAKSMSEPSLMACRPKGWLGSKSAAARAESRARVVVENFMVKMGEERVTR
jgi:hypothetical protein